MNDHPNHTLAREAQLNQALAQAVAALSDGAALAEAGPDLLRALRSAIPVDTFDVFAALSPAEVIQFPGQAEHAPHRVDPPSAVAALLKMTTASFRETHPTGTWTTTLPPSPDLWILTPLDAIEVTPVVVALRITGPSPADLSAALKMLRRPLELAIERTLLNQTLDRAQRQLYTTATRDPLTSLFTRFYMEEAAPRLLHLSDRNAAAQVSALLMDVDGLRRINETYGHAAGDLVLREVAGVVMQTVRRTDLPVRLAGEEFVVFAVGRSAQAQLRLAQRLRRKVSELRFEGPMSALRVTISLGVTARIPGEALMALLQRVDDVLHDAKRDGIDQIAARPATAHRRRRRR